MRVTEIAGVAAAALLVPWVLSSIPGAGPDVPAAGAELAARVDPFVARPRLLVLTDIGNEPDDQMSMVRLLVYANEFDIEGLVATTSTWQRRAVKPEILHTLIDAYAQVQPNLLKHRPDFPGAATLHGVVRSGQSAYGMAAVGDDRMTPGAELIVTAADETDIRPLWITVWGGANTLAQALLHVRATRTPPHVDAFVSRLRVYSISDQDDAGPWIRREFPALHYIVTPSPPDGEQYYFATWTGISGDRFYRNAPGADFTTFSDAWIDRNIRRKGPLGARYLRPCCIHEGDTPSFLGLINNGLASAMSPTYGGWGGRYVWRTSYGETRPAWTQGGDSYPGNDSSRDTVTGADGQPHTSDQATIWRWREPFQNDFAARMDWTIADVRDANHNPEVVVNGHAGQDPLTLETRVGAEVVLDAAGTTDPDGNALAYRWFFYPEAGMGIPGLPVAIGERAAPGAGDIPSAPVDGPPQPVPRVTLRDADARRVTVMPKVRGIAHVILAVEDNGSPALTSYRRVILRIHGAN